MIGMKQLAKDVGARMRANRVASVKTLIEASYVDTGRCQILDIGGEGVYWTMFDPDYLRTWNVTVTLCNLEYRPAFTADLDPGIFSSIIGNGCALDCENKAYDLAHSNSVLEHVGQWPEMRKFAAETRRVARRYYVQMPYFWFPYEPHFGAPFFHWLPEAVRVSMVLGRSMGHYPRADSLDLATQWVQSAQLLDRRQFTQLFPDAVIVREKLVGLTKSLIAIRR